MSGKQNSKRAWGICVVATVAAIAILSAGSPVWADAIVDVDDLVVNPDESITSAVMVNDVESPYSLGAGTIRIEFDTTVVDPTAVTAGDANFTITSWSKGTQVSGDIYLLQVGFWDLMGGHTGDVTPFTVTWHAVGNAGDLCDLTLECPSDLTDYDTLGQIPHSCDDGSFTIIPEPSSLVLLVSLAVTGGLMVLWRRRRR